MFMRTQSRDSIPARPAHATGFSLLEMLGAMAILAIIIATAAPPLIRMLSESRRRSENRMMDRIADALQGAVLHFKTVPSTNPANWGPILAAELSLPKDVVTTNAAGVPRRIVFDPALNLAGLGPAQLPFHQQSQGASAVANVRLVILSALQPDYPALDLHSAEAFSNLWHCPDNRLPAGWPADWAADPGDLVIRRVDLGSLFHEVILSNLDPFQSAPFAILTNALSGSGSTNAVAITNLPFATRFLHGTPLRLLRPNASPQAVTFITESSSFAFEQGRWSRRVHAGVSGPTSCGVLGGLVELFLNHPGWTPTAQGTTPESVVLGMFDMLAGCKDWADTGFENENGHSKWEAPTARFVFDVAPQLMLSSEDLIGL